MPPEPDATSKLDRSQSDQAPEPTSPQPLVPGVEPGHLVPPAEAAALSFLGLLAMGAALLVAVKLQYPKLGAGANTIDVLSSVVILALATLRVPIHLGDLTLTVLPLGALVVTFFVVRWACRVAAPSAPPRRGLVVGAIFAAIALVAALVFRFRFDPDPVYAGAFGSAFFGFLWASLFSAVAFAGSREPLAKSAGRRLVRLHATKPALAEGVMAAGVMLVVASVLATAAGLVWVIFSLLGGGGPRDLEAGDLFAALVYVAAFAPNLIVMMVALSLGAPVDAGAGLTVHGKLRGTVEQWSVFSDAGLSILLLLVPLLACGAGGYWARRNTRDPRRMVPVLGWTALIFAATLAILGWLGEARLGAYLAGTRGFGVVAPRAWIVFLLGALWAGGAGYAGWTLADKRQQR